MQTSKVRGSTPTPTTKPIVREVLELESPVSASAPRAKSKGRAYPSTPPSRLHPTVLIHG